MLPPTPDDATQESRRRIDVTTLSVFVLVAGAVVVELLLIARLS
jgi:hypothetical protein